MRLPTVLLLLILLVITVTSHELTVYPTPSDPEYSTSLQILGTIQCHQGPCEDGDKMTLTFPHGTVVVNLQLAAFTANRELLQPPTINVDNSNVVVVVWKQTSPLPVDSTFTFVGLVKLGKFPDNQEDYTITLDAMGKKAQSQLSFLDTKGMTSATYLSPHPRSPTHGYNSYHMITNVPKDTRLLSSIQIIGAMVMNHSILSNTRSGTTPHLDETDSRCFVNGVESVATHIAGGKLTISLSPLSMAANPSAIIIQCPEVLVHYEHPKNLPFKFTPNFSYILTYTAKAVSLELDDINDPESIAIEAIATAEGAVTITPLVIDHIPAIRPIVALVDDVLDTHFQLDYGFQDVDYSRDYFNYKFTINGEKGNAESGIIPGGVRLANQYRLDLKSGTIQTQVDATKAQSLETIVRFINTRTTGATFGYIAQLRKPPKGTAKVVAEISLTTYQNQITLQDALFTVGNQIITDDEKKPVIFQSVSTSSLEPFLESGNPSFVFREIEHKDSSYKLSININLRKPELTTPLTKLELDLLPAFPAYHFGGDPSTCEISGSPVKAMAYPQPFNSTTVQFLPSEPITKSKKPLTLKCSGFYIHLPTHFKDDKFEKVPIEILGYSTITKDDQLVYVQKYGLMKFVNPFLNNGQGATTGGIFAILGLIGLCLGLCVIAFIFMRWRTRRKKNRKTKNEDAYEQLV